MTVPEDESPAREDLKEQFLRRIETRHGKGVREACARLLPQSGEFSPLSILKSAQEEVYRDQIEAAAAMDASCFDSDGDL